MPKAKLYDFDYEGKHYYGLGLKEISEITDIKKVTLRQRLNKGMSLQEAIDKPVEKRNLYDFEYEGKHYSGLILKEIEEITGISLVTLISRMKKNMSIQEAIDKPLRGHNRYKYNFEYQGKYYSCLSLAEVEEITGINQRTFYERSKKMSIQEAIDKPVNENMSRTNEPTHIYHFDYEGKHYSCFLLKEIEKITGIKQITLYQRLKKMSIQEAIDKPIGSIKNYKEKLYSFNYEGQYYSDLSLAEVEEITGIKKGTLYSRLKKMSIQKAIDKHFGANKNHIKQLYDFDYQGEHYFGLSLTEISEITGINLSTLYRRLEERGMSIQEAIDEPVKKHKHHIYDFDYNGQHYSGLGQKEISELTGINLSTLYSRLNRRSSIQEVIDQSVYKSKNRRKQ